MTQIQLEHDTSTEVEHNDTSTEIQHNDTNKDATK